MMLPSKYLKFICIAIAIIGLDQLTKWIVYNSLMLHEVVPVIPGCLNLVHIQNPGTAFGLFADYNSFFRNILVMSASIVAILLILYLYKNTSQDFPVLSFGFALIFGGAIGNMIDRVRLGRVIDFIDVYIGSLHWPAFNVADSAITVGMIIFAYYILFRKNSGLI